MYQIVSKKWGLSETGEAIRLNTYVCDEDGEQLPEDIPVGSDCHSRNGEYRVFFGRDVGWVKVQGSVNQAELEKKADVDGDHPRLLAGSARSVRSKIVNRRKFTFDDAGGRDFTDCGKAQIRKIYGRTMKFRQMLPPPSVDTLLQDEHGYNNLVWHTSGCIEGYIGVISETEDWISQTVNIPLINGHKYLLRGCDLLGGENLFYLYIQGSNTHCDYGKGVIFTGEGEESFTFGLRVIEEGDVCEDVLMFPQLFDLTEMFGIDEEPEIEDFNRCFPVRNYGYSAVPEIINLRGGTLKTVGENLLSTIEGFGADQRKAHVKRMDLTEKHSGGYALFGSYETVRFSTKEDAIDNDTYDIEDLCLCSESNSEGKRYEYIAPPQDGWVFIEGAGEDTKLFKIGIGTYTGRNYQYTPYKESRKDLTIIDQLFPNGMRGLSRYADFLSEDKAVQMIAEVNLADLNWIKNDKYFITRSLKTGEDGFPCSKKERSPNFIMTLFIDTVHIRDIMLEGRQGIGYDEGGAIYLRVDGVNTVSELKSAMAGYKLYYVLDEPIETIFDEPIDLSFEALGGTEEYIPGEEPSAFICFDAVYNLDVEKKLRLLPMPTPADAGKTVMVDEYGTGFVFV